MRERLEHLAKLGDQEAVEALGRLNLRRSTILRPPSKPLELSRRGCGTGILNGGGEGVSFEVYRLRGVSDNYGDGYSHGNGYGGGHGNGYRYQGDMYYGYWNGGGQGGGGRGCDDGEGYSRG